MNLQLSVLLSIGATGFAVSFVHSILPTHWLPFVLAARGQKWTRAKTLSITALASGGHSLFTALLGVLVLALGVTVEKWTGQVFPWIAAGLLATFGLWYLLRPAGAHGHRHHLSFEPLGGHSHDLSPHHGHEHAHAHPHGHAHAAPAGAAPPVSDRAAILGLLAMLTFSPCEAFLPVYLSGVSYGWWGFALLSAMLALGCLVGMLAFTSLALVGLSHLKLERIERYEDRILGALLVLLAVLVLVFEVRH